MIDERNFTKFLDKHEIEVAVQDLAKKINTDYEGKTILLVAVLKGAISFVSDLIRYLDVSTEIEFVRLTRQAKEKTDSGTVTIIKDIETDLKNKNIIIVEEIIDSGRTLKFLYDRLSSSNAESVEVATLLDKASKRLVDIPVKYVGKQVDDQFLIGYGLDLEEKCRNLSDIYYLKYPN